MALQQEQEAAVLAKMKVNGTEILSWREGRTPRAEMTS